MFLNYKSGKPKSDYYTRTACSNIQPIESISYLLRIPGRGRSCANSKPSAINPTRKDIHIRVEWVSLTEQDKIKKINPAGQKKLGAMPMKVMEVFIWTQRIAYIGLIASKHSNPIQPKIRLALLD